ncbi:MAG: 30S ribosome-binding factor RbfA [Candidatus Delongbacteria bacterium]
MASEKRQQRVAEQIRKELGTILQREHSELASQVTVGEVRLSPDLSHANVFVSLMGDEARREVLLKELMHRNKEIRRSLAGRMRLRAVPLVRFLLDLSLDRAERLESLLEQIQAERAPDPAADDAAPDGTASAALPAAEAPPGT